MLHVGGLDCPALSRSPHATTTLRTTVADPEAHYLWSCSSLSCDRASGRGVVEPGTGIETTTDNHARSRELQQDARAWASFTGTTYTAALRQMKAPLAQGMLGQRVSARALVASLNDHELIGARGADARLGDNGYSDSSWSFNGETDFVELALVTDMLRMFTPIAPTAPPEVSSYSLKHTAEEFLGPACSYVSNGRLIWAAAALGLPIAAPDEGRLNLWIGVPADEHAYVRRTLDPGQTLPQAHHIRPPGYEHLRTALDRHAVGEPVGARWVRSTPTIEPAPFHDWLVQQIGRPDAVGTLATDYSAGVRDSDHQIARVPEDLLSILQQIDHSARAYDAVVSAITEWWAESESPQPIRTERIEADSYDHMGWRDGSGDVERYSYRCPCGEATIVEEHENVPGFRDHDVWLTCDRCRSEWRFADGRSVRS